MPPDATDWQPPVLENMLLSVASFWKLRMDKNIQIDLISRNFQQEDILAALDKVKNCPGFDDTVGKITNRVWGKDRTAIAAQAKDLVELLEKLGNMEKKPRFVIHCEDLHRASSIMGGLSVRDERAVSARMESLEVGLRKVMEAVQQQGAAGRTSSFQPVPKVVVTSPVGTGTAAPAGDRRQEAGAPVPAGARRQGVHGGRLASQAGPRDLSPSQKRPRVEEQETVPREESPWVKVARKPRKTAVGKSSVDLEEIGEGALAGPVEMYISNTNNKSDSDTIKKVLETCAAKIDPNNDFKVIKVEPLTKDPNPRTRCWKVTVPFKFKDLMENNELYPSGWRYRKFFAARNNRKKPERSEDSIENRVIQEQAKEREHELQVLNQQQAKEPEVQVLNQEASPAGGAVTAQ